MTFTVPKLLRPYFCHNCTLFAELMQLIHRMVADFQRAAVGKHVTGATVMAYRSAGEFLRHHPHVHGIFLEGGFDAEGVSATSPLETSSIWPKSSVAA